MAKNEANWLYDEGKTGRANGAAARAKNRGNAIELLAKGDLALKDLPRFVINGGR